ncbi:MAG: O-antigen ligase family protein [Bacteroidetes bacterium]|nr:O-antigen ligase family protein [Bacteroidota bacterium]
MKIQKIVLSIITSISSITPIQLILFLTLFLPIFDFTDNTILNIIRHALLRFIIGYIAIYTLIILSQQKALLRFPSLNFEKPLLLYTVTIVISVVFSLLKSQMIFTRALFSVLTYPLLIVTFYVIPFWFDTKTLQVRIARYLIYSFYWTIILSIILVLLSFFSPSLFGFTRLSSIFHDPNIFARFLLFGIFYMLSFYFFDTTNTFRKNHLIIFCLLALICLVLTLSRSSLLTLMFGIIVFAFLLKNRKKEFLTISVVLIICIVAIIIIFILRIESNAQSAVLELSTFNRLQILIGGIDILKKNWLFGIGYTNFQNFYASNYMQNAMSMTLEMYEQKGFTVSMHNWFLEVFCEQGIFGLIGFIWFFYSFFKELVRSIKNTNDRFYKPLLIGHSFLLATYLIQGFFYHTFISLFSFWIYAGFAVSTIKAAEKIALKDKQDNAILSFSDLIL